MAPDTASFLLRVVDLAAGHGRAPVLRGVTLEIRPGESWFVLGTNAAGKSTLLHTMLGVLRPLGGRIDRASGFGHESIGFVPQRCDLAPNLPTNAREFVSLGLVGIAVPRAERAARVKEALEQVGLGGLEAKSYWAMSGGQRQRVLVARALARRPRLLCVDEPLNNLDLPTERALLKLFARRREAGTAIVFVTHNVAIAAHLATHVVLVRDGGAEVGPAAEILRPDRLERAYGGPVAIVPIPGLAATPAGAASAAEAAS